MICAGGRFLVEGFELRAAWAASRVKSRARYSVSLKERYHVTAAQWEGNNTAFEQAVQPRYRLHGVARVSVVVDLGSLNWLWWGKRE